MDAVSDETLMQWLQAGDDSCLGALFERHHLALFQYCVHLTRDRSAAEDVVQDAFFRVLKKRKSYKGAGSFKSWLFNIARNAAFDHLRKARRFTDIESVPETEDDAAAPDQHHSKAEYTALVEAILQKLPVEVREVIWLGKFHFDNYEELGLALACSPGAAKVRLHRAMKKLTERVLASTQGMSYEL